MAWATSLESTGWETQQRGCGPWTLGKPLFCIPLFYVFPLMCPIFLFSSNSYTLVYQTGLYMHMLNSADYTQILGGASQTKNVSGFNQKMLSIIISLRHLHQLGKAGCRSDPWCKMQRRCSNGARPSNATLVPKMKGRGSHQVKKIGPTKKTPTVSSLEIQNSLELVSFKLHLDVCWPFRWQPLQSTTNNFSRRMPCKLNQSPDTCFCCPVPCLLV